MNQKINSELHTIASIELQEEIDAILAEEKDKEKDSEDTVEYDGTTGDKPNPKGE